MQPTISPDAHELRRRHITEWETGSTPIREDIRSANDGAIKFAESAIKNLTYINAGGLIALPVVMGLFGATINTDSAWILGISLPLIGGLVMAVSANVAGFFAMARRGEADQEELEALAIQLILVHQPLEQTAIASKKLELAIAQNAQKQKLESYSKFRLLGLAMMIGSLVFFLIAIGTAGLWYKAKSLPLTSETALNLPAPRHWDSRSFSDK